jgi:type II secretory pathway component PulK
LRYNRKNAVALVGVLWVVLLGAVIITTTAQSSRLDMRMVAHTAEKIRGKWASRAGLELAIAVLNEDEREYDSLDDRWYEHEGDFNEVEVGDCRVDVRVIDASSRLNINAASYDQLEQLDYITPTIIDSVLDWIDKDDTQRNDGAEQGYYADLEPSYVIRNGDFRTIREMLLVKEIKNEYLFGEQGGWAKLLTCFSKDKNKTSDDSQRININNANQQELAEKLNIDKSYAKWIAEKKPQGGYKSIADLIDKNTPDKPEKKDAKSDEARQIDMQTFKDIADKITVTDDQWIKGRLNVNTASREVLRIFFEDDTDLADNIVDARHQRAVPMISVADVMDISGMGIDKFKKYAEMLTTRSDIYLVSSKAKTVGLGLKFRTEAVIDRSGNEPRIISMYYGMEN